MKKDIINIDNRSGKNNLWYEFINNKGEKVEIEITKCFTDPRDKNSLPNIWKNSGFTKTLINNYLYVSTYVSIGDECFSMYNPFVIKNNHKINFDWLLEVSDENIEKILNEIYRLANE